MALQEDRLELAQERLVVGKRRVPTGLVRVATQTETYPEIVEAALEREEFEVLRVPHGTVVDAPPALREDGDVLIVPVVEERLVVTRQWVLTEEIHIRRRRSVETVRTPVTLRKQRAVVTREKIERSERTPHMGEYDYSERTLTAFFDDRASADAAVARLHALGLTDASVRVTGGEDYVGRSDTDKGFWDSVADFFLPAEDNATYAEGLRRGGYLVTVNGLSTANYDQALDILDDEGSVDLDARAESWRSEGWTGGDYNASRGSGLAGVAAGAAGADVTGAATTTGYGQGTDTSRSSATQTETARREGADDEVIPVIEEQLRVGKRDVNLGRVRVRAYVVEEPVNEEVRLREERVEIERRPVDRAVAPGEAAFVDRTIEAQESAEEAVVSKEARITEEIGLRRESQERTETVSDTIRHTEVEVEDERGVERDVTKRTETDRI